MYVIVGLIFMVYNINQYEKNWCLENVYFDKMYHCSNKYAKYAYYFVGKQN